MQDPKSPTSTWSNENPNGGIATQDQPADDASTVLDAASDKASGFQEKATEKASELQEKASEVGTKLHESAEAGIDRAADGLEKAAVQLRSRAEDGGGVQEKVGVRVADGLDKTSQYLRDHEAQEIWTDVEQFVKDHPMQAAVGALVAGYVVAKVMK